MNERIQITTKLIGSHIVLIIGLLITSIFVTNDDFLFLSITQTTLILVYFAGYWEFFGLQFKRTFCLIMELTLLITLISKLDYGFYRNANVYLLIFLSFIQVYLLIELIKIIIVKIHKDPLSLDIEFPLKNGTYLITDGGNSKISRLMNYHYYSPIHKKNRTNRSMLYATDIVRIDNKKREWLPIKNEDYPVYKENIYSPTNGRIVKIENSIPDNEPFSGNYPYNTGNTVVIQKDNYFLLLGHLKRDSIVVNVGDVVQCNDLIGAVGNSGWTERPHIHMQLIKSDSANYWTGLGVCIRFKNKILSKNRLIKN